MHAPPASPSFSYLPIGLQHLKVEDRSLNKTVWRVHTQARVHARMVWGFHTQAQAHTRIVWGFQTQSQVHAGSLPPLPPA